MIHNVMLPCLRIACLHMFLLCNFVWNHCKLGSAPTVWHCTPISLMPSSLPPVNEPSFCKHFRYHYPTVNHVRILGVVLDPRITLSEHTKAISNCCLYHFRALRHIRGSLDYSGWPCYLRLNYANSVLYLRSMGLSLASVVLKIPNHARVNAGNRTPCSNLATLS